MKFLFVPGTKVAGQTSNKINFKISKITKKYSSKYWFPGAS
jgi:hypothetical protein